MHTYILYTSEGYCESPDGNQKDNYQVLGLEYAESRQKALEQLLADSPWIIASRYDRNMVIIKETI